jgi:hypothetical protein
MQYVSQGPARCRSRKSTRQSVAVVRTPMAVRRLVREYLVSVRKQLKGVEMP